MFSTVGGTCTSTVARCYLVIGQDICTRAQPSGDIMVALPTHNSGLWVVASRLKSSTGMGSRSTTITSLPLRTRHLRKLPPLLAYGRSRSTATVGLIPTSPTLRGDSKIADYNEFDLFRMCFPEDFVCDVMIPATNKNLIQNINLQEFYIWLGCIFFMACYEGVPDRELWWSMKPIDMFNGAPF